MKPIDNAEDFVKRGKAKITTGSQMDKRVLDDSFSAMDEAIAAQGLSVPRILQRSRAAKLAAAAVIVIAVGLLITESEPPERGLPPIRGVAESPADMLSAISLNMAYRRGGIEAVDEVSSKAFKALGSRPVRVSLRELLAESNGV